MRIEDVKAGDRVLVGRAFHLGDVAQRVSDGHEGTHYVVEVCPLDDNLVGLSREPDDTPAVYVHISRVRKVYGGEGCPPWCECVD